RGYRRQRAARGDHQGRAGVGAHRPAAPGGHRGAGGAGGAGGALPGAGRVPPEGVASRRAGGRRPAPDGCCLTLVKITQSPRRDVLSGGSDVCAGALCRGCVPGVCRPGGTPPVHTPGTPPWTRPLTCEDSVWYRRRAPLPLRAGFAPAGSPQGGGGGAPGVPLDRFSPRCRIGLCPPGWIFTHLVDGFSTGPEALLITSAVENRTTRRSDGTPHLVRARCPSRRAAGAAGGRHAPAGAAR